MEAAITLRAEMRKVSPDLSVAELNQLISLTSTLPTFQAVDLAYKNLISGGALADFLNLGLKKELAEFYAAHELTKLIQNTQELQYVTIWQPYALDNLDYAASNTKQYLMRENTALRPYFNPDLVLRVRAEITSHFGIPSPSHLRSILTREILNVDPATPAVSLPTIKRI